MPASDRVAKRRPCLAASGSSSALRLFKSHCQLPSQETHFSTHIRRSSLWLRIGQQYEIVNAQLLSLSLMHHNSIR